MAISNELRRLVDPNNECCCEHCLSNKCKEWANDNGYFIHIRNDHRIGRTKYTAEAGTDLSSVFGVEGFYGEDEVDVTFRACQWILDSKGTR